MGPLKTLLQHLCTKAPDKADYRSKLSSVCVDVGGLEREHMCIHGGMCESMWVWGGSVWVWGGSMGVGREHVWVWGGSMCGCGEGACVDVWYERERVCYLLPDG